VVPVRASGINVWQNISARCDSGKHWWVALTGNNKPVADFYCENSSEEYELKSKNGNVGKKIVDGAYSSMITRLLSDNNPNFFFLTYDKSTLGIRNFLTIPKYFFVPGIIEKRKALNPTSPPSPLLKGEGSLGGMDWLQY